MIIEFNPVECLLLAVVIIIVTYICGKIDDLLIEGYTKKGYCYAS